MVQNTTGIVLRAVKYGESSLVCTIFTSVFGVEAYMVQGVRSTKMARNRSGLLQPASLTDMVVYHQPQKTMQRIREFQPAYIYASLQEDVVRNSIALFSVELLLRLLPEHAPLPDLFDLAYEYFVTLDKVPLQHVANFPLYFIIACSRELGYELKGSYSSETPFLNLQEGGYTSYPPALATDVTTEDSRSLDELTHAASYDDLYNIFMGADRRMRLTEWYVAFLQAHSQHMSSIRSLAVLRTILH